MSVQTLSFYLRLTALYHMLLCTSTSMSNFLQSLDYICCYCIIVTVFCQTTNSHTYNIVQYEYIPWFFYPIYGEVFRRKLLYIYLVSWYALNNIILPQPSSLVIELNPYWSQIWPWPSFTTHGPNTSINLNTKQEQFIWIWEGFFNSIP